MEASVLKNVHSNRWPYYTLLLLLSVAGLSFLFFLGFPFANHNESYLWVVILNNISFTDALTTRLEPVQSFRPLGTATAWLTYKLTGHIYLQQVVNWAFACFSFGILFKAAKNKLFFSAAAFVATVGFFAGYIYLFHLHGVFYGPLQLYIAYLTTTAVRHQTIPLKKLSLLFGLTLVAALYHTFALLVFAAFVCGCVLQVPKREWRKQWPLLFGFLIFTLLLIYIVLRYSTQTADSDVVQGSLISFTTTELNLPLHILATLFALITAYTLPLTKKLKSIAAIVVFLSAALLIYMQLPVLLLWILACLVKMMLRRAWAAAAIVFATAVFPAATHTGTPTYIVFVIMVCVFITAIDNPVFLNSRPSFINWSIPDFLALLLVALFLLKAGVQIPGLSSGLHPLLAEREKTHQLETILHWKEITSAYAMYGLRFFEESKKPSASKNALNRTFRPPTQQKYLDRYCTGFMKATPDTSAAPLLITFGNEAIEGRKKIFEVAGRWNSKACVYQ